MVENSQVFQHFHPEEKAFVERMLDKVDRVQTTYSYELTTFLNPREAFIVESLARRAGLEVYSSGQFYKTEAVRLIIAPDYYHLVLDDFEMTLLALDYARKFNQLSHSQILGNLVNQLGIKRQLLGDILITDDQTQLIVDTKISHYLIQNITKISRIPVTWTCLDFSQLIQGEEVAQSQSVLTTSLRLDSLLAAAYPISRQVANKLIEQNKVKVNHQPLTQPAHQLKVGDLVSCRGFGRFKISQSQGVTRNGKFKLTLAKIGGK